MAGRPSAATTSQPDAAKPPRGRVAVVTGAASGMGAAVARPLMDAGARLVVCDRSAEKLSALFGREAEAESAIGDITEARVASALLDTALRRFGRCDIVFNDAGTCEVGSIEAIDIDRVRAMVRVNVEAAFRVAYTFVQHFARTGSGRLISTSSAPGTKVRPTAGAYAGAKHAIEALSEALRVELARTAVKISCIEPGLVVTNLHDSWSVHPREVLDIREPLEAQDIARFVLWIVTQPERMFVSRLMGLPKEQEIGSRAGVAADGSFRDVHTPLHDFNDEILIPGAGYSGAPRPAGTRLTTAPARQNLREPREREPRNEA